VKARRINGVLVLLAALVLWEILARLEVVHPVFFPRVSVILRTFAEMTLSGEIPGQVLVSLGRAAAGYGLAAVVFVPLGIVMGLYRPIQRALEPIVELLRPIPPPAMVPVAIVFFGLDDAMKVFVIFISCAWPILLNTIDGVRAVDRVLLNTASTLNLSPGKTITDIIVPAASPQIMTGLRISLAVTLILVVFSEMVGSTNGIGYVVLAAQRSFRVPEMYAGMLALALVGWGLNTVFLVGSSRIMAWHEGLIRRGG